MMRDRLSSLPDSVLCHILSFLYTKFSVATSILARRWRFLWKDVPTLDFGDEFFLEHLEENRCAKIIYRVMLLHNARNINTFCIWDFDGHSSKRFSNNDLDVWLRTAIARNVQVVDLAFAFRKHYLPTCIYACKTLVKLYLWGLKLLSGAVCLPHLRKLRLCDVYCDAITLTALIYGCPVLEEVTIKGYNPHSLHCGEVSSTIIKRLKLDLQRGGCGAIEGDQLEINIPGLRYLQVKQNEETLLEHFTAATLNDIVKADVYLRDLWVRDDVLYSQSVKLFVERLCQVKSLRLSSRFTKFLDADFAAATSRFQKLIELELAADWHFLIKFLQSADNLKVLIINKARESEEKLKCWMEPPHLPTCLSSHLRQVKIDPFECLGNEFKMWMLSY